LFAGKHGVIKKNNVNVAQCQNWKLDVTGNLLDGTSLMQDWKVQAAGIMEWKGSFDLLLDPAITEHGAILAAIIAATGMTILADMVFFVDGVTPAKKFSGNVWINGFSPAAAVGDMVKCPVTFTGDGALTYTA
jgi:hypothetical protein